MTKSQAPNTPPTDDTATKLAAVLTCPCIAVAIAQVVDADRRHDAAKQRLAEATSQLDMIKDHRARSLGTLQAAISKAMHPEHTPEV